MELDLIIKISMGFLSAIVTIGAAITGWAFKMVFDQIAKNTRAIKEVDDELDEHKLHTARTYATRIDMNNLTDRIIAKLDTIEAAQAKQHASILEKLSYKADR